MSSDTIATNQNSVRYTGQNISYFYAQMEGNINGFKKFKTFSHVRIKPWPSAWNANKYSLKIHQQLS